MRKEDIKSFIYESTYANVLILFCSLKTLAFPVSLSPEDWKSIFEVTYRLPTEKMPFLFVIGFVIAIFFNKLSNSIPKIWKGNLKRCIIKSILAMMGFSVCIAIYLYILGADFQMYIMLDGIECGMLVSLIYMMVRDVYFPLETVED